MDNSKTNLNREVAAWILGIIFLFSFLGSTALLMYSSKAEANPIVILIQSHNKLGMPLLFVILSVGVLLALFSGTYSAKTMLILAVGAMIMFFNFIRELILAFAH